jgi:gamma-glutamyltranspeptidase / glutathione hydrolase
MAVVFAPFATVHAPTAMVASADQLASQAGILVLRRGGTAVDAAIATNAVLAVTGPHMCGMGGDLFALVHQGPGAPAALNASGRAGSGADPDGLRAAGHTVMPFRGSVHSIPVPGCVDGWVTLHQRFGRMPMADVLEPAIAYAEGGFPASPLLVGALPRLDGLDLPDEWREIRQTARHAGAPVRRPGVGRALRAVAADGRAGFYGGEFGAGLLALGAGEFSPADLDRPLADWVDPLVVDVWERRLWSMPPNSQGYLTLAAAWIAAGLDLPADPDDGRWAAILVDAAVEVGHDRPDVLAEGADGGALVAPEHLELRRAAVGRGQAGRRLPVGPGDTTYLCVVDGDGLAVSLIQSNASGFGSHVFEPNTAINLHNRGIGFSLEPGHPAEYGPGRRPPHTLCPALVTHADGTLDAVLGTQGGDGQPQILLQVVARRLAAAQSPARSVGSARWVLTGTGQGFDTWTTSELVVAVEDHAPAAWTDVLRRRGYDVATTPAFAHTFGHANLITVTPDGTLAGAADPRARIGAALGF